MALLNKRKKKKLKTPIPKASCPYCWEWLKPTKIFEGVFSGEGCLGGHCECGVAYVIDDTGKSGGQARLDVLALACNGDLDRAMAIEEGVDFELKINPVVQTSHPDTSRNMGSPMMQPNVWAIKLLDPE